MSNYYDRQGKPLGVLEWAQMFENPSVKRVAETTLSDGKWVSTVWLGLGHNWGVGPPLIFETMVFESKQNMSDLDCERYATEAEAVAGHAAMVERWSQPAPGAAHEEGKETDK